MRIWVVDEDVDRAESSGRVVDDVRAFAGEQHRHRATVADRLARRLPGPDHDRMLAEQSFPHARRS